MMRAREGGDMDIDKLIDADKMPKLLFASDGLSSRLWVDGREVSDMIAVNITARHGWITNCKIEFAVVPI